MALKARFKEQHILNRLKLEFQRVELDLIEIFQRVGEKAVTDARDAVNISGNWKQRVLTPSEIKKNFKTPKWGDYLTQSQNLRSSIGYFILKDESIIDQNLEGTADGVAAAIKALQEVPRIGKLQLILVAGLFLSCIFSEVFYIRINKGRTSYCNSFKINPILNVHEFHQVVEVFY